MFEIELFICLKMDLALIISDGLSAIKRNETKPNLNVNLQSKIDLNEVVGILPCDKYINPILTSQPALSKL